MKKKFATIAIICVIAIAIAGLIWTFRTGQNPQTVSDGVAKVVATMTTCPNSDLFSLDAITNVGTGVNASEADKAKTKAANEKIDANWYKAVGTYFAKGSFESFLSSGVANVYLAEADLTGKEISLKAIELVEKKDTWETVKVTVMKDDNEEQFQMVFQHDNKGAITKVTIS